jgi:spoIIIJ-associated protein
MPPLLPPDEERVRSVEAEGATVEEAVARALGELKLARSEVDVEQLVSADAVRVRVTARADVSRGTSEPEEVARRVLAETLRMLGFTCEISTRPRDDAGSVVLDVSGLDESLVIGRDGQMLDALEHVLNRIAFREAYGAGRIVVDVGDYRKRCQQALEALSHRLAEQARETGRPVAMDPMSARDRRIVHLALADNAGVTTRSDGEGQYRHLVIVPKGQTDTRS